MNKWPPINLAALQAMPVQTQGTLVSLPASNILVCLQGVGMYYSSLHSGWRVRYAILKCWCSFVCTNSWNARPRLNQRHVQLNQYDWVIKCFMILLDQYNWNWLRRKLYLLKMVASMTRELTILCLLRLPSEFSFSAMIQKALNMESPSLLDSH